MYKNILTLIILLLFASCSAPKPKQLPAWYTSPPSDFKNFYVVASDKDITKAKKLAIQSFRKELNIELDSQILSNQGSSKTLSEQQKKEIISDNSLLCNKLSMRKAKLQKQELFEGKYLVLLSIEKEELFKQVDKSYTPELTKLKEAYSLASNNIDVKKYFLLKPLANETTLLLAQNHLKATILSTYSEKDDFDFLTQLNSEYQQLKNKITFYIISDASSISFAKKVKEVFIAEGLKLSRTINKDTLKLIISSKTQNSQEYDFNKAKSLVKFTTYDYKKNEISFKQHTFIGKSRKNYSEAKQQSAIHLKYKMNKVGIFDFIGL